ncbi:hypothetical protein O6H91_17G054000 [Diphasiastrum complanatum]|uniref:Uncharacterized protein n=1 Tax=Diphasiastrum complanatum TaxID=34168 RepID=A0ACC2B6Y3_DIPCM|nr:hypothetical protein O6H91_17G054000 [Diphasiastrum complanatum]
MKQAPAPTSVDKPSGSLKLILKHGAWRREKLIGQVQLPEKNGASKVTEKLISQVQLPEKKGAVTEKLVAQVQLPEKNGLSKVPERQMGRRVKSQQKSIQYPMQEININESTNSKNPDHENTDALMLLEIQETLALSHPKEDSEQQICNKLVDPASGSCREMDKTDDAIDFSKDPLPADITCRVALDDREKSMRLQGNLDKIKEDGNHSGQNFIPQQKEEQRVSLQQQYSVLTNDGGPFPAIIELINIPDAVIPGGRVSTHLKKKDVVQSNSYTDNTSNSKDTRFHRNTELVTLCSMKPGFLSVHGTIFDKKEDKVNLVQQKLDKAGGLQNWLVKSGLGQFVKIFQEKNVEIPELLDLNMGALKQMGAAAVGPRRKLIHAIDSLF